MNAPKSAASAKKLESGTAEEICNLLEQTVLKYFPQSENDVDRPKPCSVPLVPHRQKKPPT